jgi:hypothetical protein
MIRHARQAQLAVDVAAGRDDERRSFLRRAWRLRFKPAPASTTPVVA